MNVVLIKHLFLLQPSNRVGIINANGHVYQTIPSNSTSHVTLGKKRVCTEIPSIFQCHRSMSFIVSPLIPSVEKPPVIFFIS